MISVFITGTPYGQNKVRGDIQAPRKWTESIREQTRNVASVSNPCVLEVTFVLPNDKYPLDFPYGPDLDNLLKRFLDALQPKPLSNDSNVMKLIASKRRAGMNEVTGAYLTIEEVPEIQS